MHAVTRTSTWTECTRGFIASVFSNVSIACPLKLGDLETRNMVFCGSKGADLTDALGTLATDLRHEPLERRIEENIKRLVIHICGLLLKWLANRICLHADVSKS
jgi:hypothetical protein